MHALDVHVFVGVVVPPPSPGEPLLVDDGSVHAPFLQIRSPLQSVSLLHEVPESPVVVFVQEAIVAKATAEKSALASTPWSVRFVNAVMFPPTFSMSSAVDERPRRM